MHCMCILALVRTRVYECAHLAGFSIKRILRYRAMPSCETLRAGMSFLQGEACKVKEEKLDDLLEAHALMHCKYK